MRHNPGPLVQRGGLPRSGDLVSCNGCGRVGVHARQLALSGCCGRRVRVVERTAGEGGFGVRLVRTVRALVLRGSWA